MHGAKSWSYLPLIHLLKQLSDLNKLNWLMRMEDEYRDIFTKLPEMKKVNKQCLLDTPRTVRVREKTCQVIVQTSRL